MEIKGLLKGHLVKNPNWLPITKASHRVMISQIDIRVQILWKKT
jgi:hypothetical protein